MIEACMRAGLASLALAVVALGAESTFPTRVLALEPVQCASGEVLAGGACVATEAVERQIDTIVRAGMAKHDLKAVVAGASVDGSPILIDAWGESMTGVPTTPYMHFRNGAIAIAYIGTVLLQLHDRGVLSLDDTLAKWFPEYPKADKVTLLMLMNGTSGYADYVDLKSFPLLEDVFRQWQPDELIAYALNEPMHCEPGTCWSYAHTNFVILGKVLEKATGRDLADLIKEGVLDPLALKDTRSESTAVIQEPVLHAYDAERGTYEESTYWNPSWTLAGGAIMTTNIADVLTTAHAIGTGQLLAEDAHRQQLAPLTAKFPPWNDKKWYGIGVFLVNGWIVQNPSFSGYAATMAYLPSRKLAIAVSVTSGPKASLDGNLSTTMLQEIAKYLAPDAPF